MRILSFLVAVALAMLIDYHVSPSVTMPNQLVAVLGWGLVLLLSPAPALQRPALRAVSPLLGVLALALAGCAIGIVTGSQPSPPGIGVLAYIGLAAALCLHGASAGATDLVGYFRAMSIAMLAAGLCCAVIAILQVFAYDSLDNHLIAIPAQQGRAGGNIGQPNQFADLMLWGLIALLPLARAWRIPGGPMLPRLGWAFAALLMLTGVVLSGSRTALFALVLIAGWGLVDRRMARALRIGLVLAPLVVIALQPVVASTAHALGAAVVLTERDGTTDMTSFRSEIWSASIALIRQQPWLGVGWGGFNFAWTLTPGIARHAGLVDNAHDLPLHLAIELGLPAALAMMGLLLFAFVRAVRCAWRLEGEAGIAARAAVLLVLVMGVHSMLEYPLWYAFLLLPTAWTFGLTLGAAAPLAPVAAGVPAAAPAPLRAWRAIGLLMVVGAVSAWLDYMIIVDLFLPPSTSSPLVERIQRAQASRLFSNQADAVAVSDLALTVDSLPLVVRSSHVLLTGRAMYVWANLLAAQGQVDKARYLAARLREFDLSGPRRWYAPCGDPAVTTKPFQCLAPDHPVSWRDFR